MAKREPHGDGPAPEGEVPREEAAEAAAGDGADALRDAVAERDETIDRLQRHVAELDNRRKRSERQMDERRRYALQDLAVALLPVIDNFELALTHAEESRDVDALHDGLKLVHDQLLGVLKKFDVERVEALGKPFDPNHHEAVGQVASDEHPDQTVIDVHQAGYVLHDRLIRPSRVIVSRGPKAGDASDEAPAGSEPAEGDGAEDGAAEKTEE